MGTIRSVVSVFPNGTKLPSCRSPSPPCTARLEKRPWLHSAAPKAPHAAGAGSLVHLQDLYRVASTERSSRFTFYCNDTRSTPKQGDSMNSKIDQSLTIGSEHCFPSQIFHPVRLSLMSECISWYSNIVVSTKVIFKVLLTIHHGVMMPMKHLFVCKHIPSPNTDNIYLIQVSFLHNSQKYIM